MSPRSTIRVPPPRRLSTEITSRSSSSGACERTASATRALARGALDRERVGGAERRRQPCVDVGQADAARRAVPVRQRALGLHAVALVADAQLDVAAEVAPEDLHARPLRPGLDAVPDRV